jgi:hypothetical protein
LDEPPARLVWNELVRRNQYRHPNQLPRRHWAHTHTAVGPDWVPFFNRWLQGAIDPDPVATFLRTELSWPEEVPVVFVATRDCAMLAAWGAFVAAWPHFLFLCSDEQPLVVSWERPEFVAWGCNGFVGVGVRHHDEPDFARNRPRG